MYIYYPMLVAFWSMLFLFLGFKNFSKYSTFFVILCYGILHGTILSLLKYLYMHEKQTIIVSMLNGITLTADYNTVLIMEAMTILVSILTFTHYMWFGSHIKELNILSLGFLLGIYGLLITNDIFNMYVWLEIILITTVGLLLLEEENCLEKVFNYICIQTLLSGLFVCSITILYAHLGTLNIENIPTEDNIAAGFFVLVLCLKVGIPPFHLITLQNSSNLSYFILAFTSLFKVFLYRLINMFKNREIIGIIFYMFCLTYSAFFQRNKKMLLININIVQSLLMLLLLPSVNYCIYQFHISTLYFISSISISCLLFLIESFKETALIGDTQSKAIFFVYMVSGLIILGAPPFVPFLTKWLFILKEIRYNTLYLSFLVLNLPLSLIFHNIAYTPTNISGRSISILPIMLLFFIILVFNLVSSIIFLHE